MIRLINTSQIQKNQFKQCAELVVDQCSLKPFFDLRSILEMGHNWKVGQNWKLGHH